ncbi:MAG TPA: S8 family serine peptidase, partial [Bacteroidales bacterium]|nr:S8 family serine peptidase [Bacteroidales bacterium]
EKLEELTRQFEEDWANQQKKVQEYALRNNLEISFEDENGVLYHMADVIDGQPIYLSTDNLGAAITTRAAELWEGGSTGLELSGDGYDKLAVWDGGKVRVSHQEFTNTGASRVTQMDNTSGLSAHATHVAGTLVAGGVVNNAKGMAYQGTLKAYDWYSDLSEMTFAANTGLEISNHSYGYGTGWELNSSNQWVWYGLSSVSPDEDYRFGFYESTSRNVDIITFNAPNYLLVTSAGNERGEGPSYAGTGGEPEKDGGVDGFDCIGGHFAIAKNTLAVGAVKEVQEYTGPESVYMTSFSSWGPADDGRIKPDVVAKGQGVYSSVSTSNTSYSTYQGTSMASPNTAGSLALLQQYYKELNAGDPMRAATLKGLTIHTADEAGPDPGPDYMFGWGLINMERASAIISDDQGQNVLDELVLNNGETYTREVTVPEGTPELRITISWTDPAATPLVAQLDPLTPMLVNDLDLHITDVNDNTYYPFKLDPQNPSAAATSDSRNNVDNVELVSIMQPTPGTYTIHIGHEDNLLNGEQAYSLIISGIDDFFVAPECVSGLSAPQNGDQDVRINQHIAWIPANFASSYDVYFGTDGGGSSSPTNIYNGQNISSPGFSYLMDLNTTYYLQIVPRNSYGTATGCAEIWSFSTMEGITEFPYFEGIEDAVIPGIPQYWSSYDLSDLKWISTTVTAANGIKSMGCYTTTGLIETDMDNWFVSPPLILEEEMIYPFSFNYRNFINNHAETLKVVWGNSPLPDDLNNILFEAVDFTTSGWTEFDTLLQGLDGVVFFGWHVSSEDGYGVFLDDIFINSTAVGIDEANESDPRIYTTGNTIKISSGVRWAGAEVSVVNLMGQVIYKGRLNQTNEITLDTGQDAGMFIISMIKGSEVFTRKLILTQ